MYRKGSLCGAGAQTAEKRVEEAGPGGLHVQGGAFQAQGTALREGAEAVGTQGCFNPRLVRNAVFFKPSLGTREEQETRM